MLAIFLVCVLVGVLTFYQVFKQGFFSALIMAVLSIVSALLAFNYHERLSPFLYGWGLGDFGPDSICLIGLFVIILLILRVIFDHLVVGNMSFSLPIDRAGAAIFGLISSLVMVGVIVLGFQSMPIGTKFLTFDRCPELADPTSDRALFPSPDGFVVGLMNMASNYCFAGENKFSHYHPDYLRELYFERLALDPESRRDAPASAVRLTNAYLVRKQAPDDRGQVVDYKSGEPLDYQGELIAVQLEIKGGKGDNPAADASDVDGVIRFALGNVRLAGFDASQKRKPGLSAYPLGFLMPGEEAVELERLDQGKIVKTGTGMVSLLFDWPEELARKNPTPPLFLEFKRTARLAMPSINVLTTGERGGAGGFEGYENVDNGALKYTGNSSPPYSCNRIKYHGKTVTPEVLKVLGFPSNEELDLAQQEDRFSGEPLELSRNAIARAHFTFDPRKSLEALGSDTHTPLFIPPGYVLLSMTIRSNPKGNEPLPYLFDSLGRAYAYSGMVAASGSRSAREIAYSVYKDKTTDLKSPKEIAESHFPKRRLAPSMRVQEVRLIYLVPQEQTPIGIMGVRVTSKGHRWQLMEESQVVKIPPR